MKHLLLLVVVLAGCADRGQSPPLNSVPGTQLYIACEFDEDCPIELPICRTHRLYVDSSEVDTIDVRQCTVECDGVEACPQGILPGDVGTYVAVSSFCLAVNDDGIVDEASPPNAYYCFAGRTPPLDGGDDYCLTDGTMLTSFWGGQSDTVLCLVGEESE